MATLLPRRFLRATGPDAAAYLQSMVSNDVESLAPGAGTYALLLTPKARVIADFEVLHTGDALVLACHPSALEPALAALVRARFRRKVEFEEAPYALVWGDSEGELATLETPVGPYRLLASPPAAPEPPERYEVARVEAGIPEFGREFDGETMPAEVGLVERGVSFTKGCYPGQEPIARLHYRGHANRGLRGLALRAGPPPSGTRALLGERDVGKLTSAVESPRFGPIGLAVLRREVEDGAEIALDGTTAVVRPLPFR